MSIYDVLIYLPVDGVLIMLKNIKGIVGKKKYLTS